MTSPSETWLDLDAIRFAISHGEGMCSSLDLIGLATLRDYQIFEDGHAALTRISDRPRTVGDLTARDLGRRVRIGEREFAIKSLEAYGREYQVILGWALNGYTYAGLDTPVEFLDYEPASARQQPGERLPSHEQAAQVLGDPETAEGAL